MKTPSFDYEHQYWSQDITTIAGLDEAGMGALAGPVVAGAVIFPQANIQKILEGTQKIPIRDSKLLSEKQRLKAYDFIKENAVSWGIGMASVEEIDILNIRKASHLAMQRAIKSLTPQPEILLIDGTQASVHPTIFSQCIIKGDQVSYSIAAASILAKVTRDLLMQKLDTDFPVYGFASHKGYGASSHMDALQKHGPSVHHRRSYAPIARLFTKQHP